MCGARCLDGDAWQDGARRIFDDAGDGALGDGGCRQEEQRKDDADENGPDPEIGHSSPPQTTKRWAIIRVFREVERVGGSAPPKSERHPSFEKAAITRRFLGDRAPLDRAQPLGSDDVDNEPIRLPRCLPSAGHLAADDQRLL